MPKSPWLASVECTKKLGVPVLANVEAIFFPICPDFLHLKQLFDHLNLKIFPIKFEKSSGKQSESFLIALIPNRSSFC